MAENKSIFHAMQVQSCNTNAIFLSLKNLLVLANTKLRNHVVTYIKNIHEKFTRKDVFISQNYSRVQIRCEIVEISLYLAENNKYFKLQ